jgi:hypothetical protein
LVGISAAEASDAMATVEAIATKPIEMRRMSSPLFRRQSIKIRALNTYRLHARQK